MSSKLINGSEVIINSWIKITDKDKLLIVTDKNHINEAQSLKVAAELQKANVEIMVTEDSGMTVGVYFDENHKIFDDYTAIIGAASYSIVTTAAAKRAISRDKKFLSLPLSTNNDKSMIGFDFISMDTEKIKESAKEILSFIGKASEVKITTKLGTDLSFGMKNRKAGYFSGDVLSGEGFGSASMEVFIPIEENKTNGIMILDGSYGYLGKVGEPIEVQFKSGKIIHISDTKDGKILSDYIKSYDDNNMYFASELGIGLNSKSRCEGNCYIEDESALGTFHIGLGRNIGLGGELEANGHFDIVCHNPNIFFDDRQLMEYGKFIIPNINLKY